ncbi:MAG: (Fe-S)-binding protein [Bacteroidia bacterium]|nr:(Fe-S)-binding protein [Bacteroidia bacterium]NNC84829.1 (Fe-S)-binding protein [Bacteroidia bacterium]NNM16494.1 (Fe-S)-binding protein [Bacteroidia bacterium]
MISGIIFTVILIAGIALFTRNVKRISNNIKLGKDVDLSDNKGKRWATMARVALGQSKMTARPIAGIMHIIIYLGFVIINVEVLEIIIDGIFNTHRIFAPYLGVIYDLLIASFEYLAFGVLLVCVLFLIRRNVLKIKRFWSKEMTAWPRSDANIILVAEVLLMAAFLTMNGADSVLQSRGEAHYTEAGSFPISGLLAGWLGSFSNESLILLERGCWWFHIVGILIFLNYIPYSKHFHIFLAFPNTYYSNLNPKGQMSNMASVTNEVKLMLDPAAAGAAPPADAVPEKFGAKDVTDLTWKQLMDSYSCTECGRCTDSCPANQTGKLLSPRKVMMDTRDRLEEVGKLKREKGEVTDDGRALLGDYISDEELWACTSCNACTEACPVNIDPLSIILDLRRFLVMEKSSAPSELNNMFTNVENNGAPWPFSPADRANWSKEL